jgi:hypothetical protein
MAYPKHRWRDEAFKDDSIENCPYSTMEWFRDPKHGKSWPESPRVYRRLGCLSPSVFSSPSFPQ